MDVKKALVLFLLVSVSASAATYYCDNYVDCENKAAASSAGDIVKVTQNVIVNVYNTDVKFVKEGTTFDCQGHVLTIRDVPYEHGLHLNTNFSIIKNCFFSNWSNSITFHGVNNTIANNTLTAFSFFGIAGSYNLISENTFKEVESVSINGDHNTFSGNSVDNNLSSWWCGTGRPHVYGSFNRIFNNTLSGVCSGLSARGRGNEIYGNVFNNSSEIDIFDSDNTSFFNNLVDGSKLQTTRATNSRIFSNLFNGSIYVHQTGLIFNNTLRCSGSPCVTLGGAHGNETNVVFNNIISCIGGDLTEAIAVWSDHAAVHHNKIANCYTGIAVFGGNNSIYSNEIYNSYDGVFLGGLSNNLSNNFLCFNRGADIRNSNFTLNTSFGSNNTCDISENWHDEGVAEGCTYKCSETVPVNESGNRSAGGPQQPGNWFLSGLKFLLNLFGISGLEGKSCAADVNCGADEMCMPVFKTCIPKTNCLPVLINGLAADKADVVFVGDGYNNSNELREDVLRLVDWGGNSEYHGLMSVEPFRLNRERFNIWAVAAGNAINQSRDGGGPNEGEALRIARQCWRGEYNLIISKRNFRSYCYFNGNCFVSVGERVGICDTPQECDGRLVLHEFGHGFAGLADEYVEELRGDRWRRPNCAPDRAAAEEWWGDLVNQGNAELGYFDGCSYVADNVRPTENSIMRHHWVVNDTFYAVNERQIREVLNRYR